MPQDLFQTPPRVIWRGDRRNDATLVPARANESGGLRYQATSNPYDRFDDEYEMPDGEIVRRGEGLQTGARSTHRVNR